MGGQTSELTGPDLAVGVGADEVGEGTILLGHAGGEAVLLVRVGGGRVCAVGAHCTHYGGPLAEGVVVGGTVRCPWHHARFELATGACSAPALSAIATYDVVETNGRVVVGGRAAAPVTPAAPQTAPERVVVVGGGAAGNLVCESLRRNGYAGSIVLISADEDLPCDRPNLSKDYLAGTAPEEWIPLHPRDFYETARVELLLGARATSIDAARRTVTVSVAGSGERTVAFDALVLATGAEPRRLAVPGADLPHVRTLRSLADSRAIIERATQARCAVVVGASFIGLETAAALRVRGLEVHVVGPEARPLERVLGPELADAIRAAHEAKGIHFHLGERPKAITPSGVVLDGGTVLSADLVVTGIGVDPRIELAKSAGLEVDDGIVVGASFETSASGIYAVGDVARYPDPWTGRRVRVEHWVLAERHAECCARNVLGHTEPFTGVPFFWSIHQDLTINYVGHGLGWDRVEVHGDIAARDAIVVYRHGDRILAVATVGRNRASLRVEAAMEAGDELALEDAIMAPKP